MDLNPIHSVSQDERSALEGSVERVSYFNQDTGQCILEVKNSLGEKFFISGKLAWVYPGMGIRGEFLSNVPQNHIWKAQNIKLSLPNSERNLKKFLRAEAFENMGPKLIKLLGKSFPDNFFSVLMQNPEHLLQVSGIGKKKQNQILESWQQFQKKTDLQSFLFSENLPLSWFHTLWAFHGEKGHELLKRAPYRIGSQHHLPFELIDSFALKRGFSLDSLERMRFGFKHVLWIFYKQGHCAYPEEKILSEAIRLLETTQEQLEDILEMEILEDQIVVEVIRGVRCLYFKEIWDLEKQLAEKLLAFQYKEPSWSWFNSHKSLGWAQDLLKIRLAPLQKEAIETALSSSLTVITGGPGTGKTTLIRSLVTIMQTQFVKMALCSPTGRAAQRLGEATNMPAQTIHRLLKYDSLTGKFIHNKKNPLDVDLVLVDEASMMDLQVMSDLIEAIPEHCALILVGDADQLPSVGAGNILSSIIASPHFRVVRLTEIYRQSEHSLIKLNAQRINSGQMPLSGVESDFQYIPVKGVEEAKSVVRNLLEHTIPQKYGIENLDEVQILVPTNQGELGAQSINEEIQTQINPFENTSPDSQSTAYFGQDFKLGDKVMVLKNDYKENVFNGDIGFIKKIDYEEQYLEIFFAEYPVRFEFSEMDRLTLAYAISVHKSQGSEYQAVIVLIMQEHIPMAQRHLVYTAITRGKQNVFLVAEPSALQKALLQVESRWENLTQLLQPTFM